jgi:sugar phosphate isomerase/epimerase
MTTERRYGYRVFINSLEDSIAYAGQNSLRQIEIGFSKDMTPKSELFSKRIDSLRKKADESNIKFSFHMPHSISISDILSPIRKAGINYFAESIIKAEELGAEILTVHMGNFYWFPVEKLMRKNARMRLLKSLDIILEQCVKHKVKLALENLVPIPHGNEYYQVGDSLDDFEYIFTRIDSPYIGFCLDTGHANMAEGVCEYINEFSNRLLNVHFHDNMGTDDTHMVIGQGTVDWKIFVSTLKKINYNGPLISECKEIEPHMAAKILAGYFSEC